MKQAIQSSMNLLIRRSHAEFDQRKTRLCQTGNSLLFQFFQDIIGKVDFCPVIDLQIWCDLRRNFLHFLKIFCNFVFGSFKHPLATMRSRDNSPYPLAIAFFQQGTSIFSSLWSIIHIKDDVRMDINHFSFPSITF